jgi:hypothetical protein
MMKKEPAGEKALNNVYGGIYFSLITENNSQPDALVIDSKTKWISFYIIFPLSINFHVPLCAIYQPCKIKKETVKNKQV